jgi:predicted dehydrogenase
VLSIYGGHFLDVLFQIVGPPKDLTAIVETQLPELTVLETGKTVSSAKPDEVMAIGALENGGLFSVQLEGAQKFPTVLQSDITGTEGVLRLTNDRAFENTEDNTVHGVTGTAAMGPRLRCCPFPRSTGHSLTLHSTRVCRTWPTCTPRSPATRPTAPPRRPRSRTP